VAFVTAVDPSTITSSTVTLTRAGTTIPASVSVAADAKSLVLSAAMVPEVAYTLALTTAIKSVAGGSLAAASSTTFTPRAPRSADIAPQDAFLRQWITLDAQGNRHVESVDPGHGVVSYSRCSVGSDCALATSWETTAVDAGSAPVASSGSIAVDGHGAVHMTYHVQSLTNLRYATCSTGCGSTANWTFAEIDTGAKPGLWSAIRADAAGGLHVVYSDGSAGGLRYAECTATCGLAGSWASVALPSTLTDAQDIDLVVTPTGTLATIYRGQGGGGYPIETATCVSSCLSGASWQVGSLLTAAMPTRGNALTVDPSGRLHAAFWTNSTVTYANCASACTQPGQWQQTTVHTQDGGISPGIAWSAGRLAVVSGSSDGKLLLATCVISCATAGDWQTQVLSTAANSGWYPRLALTGDGQPVVVTGTATAQYLE
jgi:hypothetical protein